MTKNPLDLPLGINRCLYLKHIWMTMTTTVNQTHPTHAYSNMFFPEHQIQIPPERMLPALNLILILILTLHLQLKDLLLFSLALRILDSVEQSQLILLLLNPRLHRFLSCEVIVVSALRVGRAKPLPLPTPQTQKKKKRKKMMSIMVVERMITLR